MAVYNPTERIGVNATEGIFVKDFNWIFREQPISDMGIDAHVEIVNEGNPTGRLIALQIKTGSSHFTDNNENLTYYGNLRHLEYWTNHSLPVILIAHLPDTNETFWALVITKNIIRTEKAWKIEIPKIQKLDSTFINEIGQIGDGTEEMIKKRKLLSDRPLMELIRGGGKISVVFMEWLHKSLNRTDVKIILTQHNKESIEREWKIAYSDYEVDEVMGLLFPWAKVNIDRAFYNINLDKKSLKKMYDLEWLFNHKLYPYQVQMNEVADYRFELDLNKLGDSFLCYLDFIENGKLF